MSTETQQQAQLHGGRLVARRLKAHGVTKLFTLSGGHLFSIFDGCREEGIDLVDVRHESAAAFAAEGWAKVTRTPGVAALTAGPGRDQRHERDRLRAAEPLADPRARRPRAGIPLGPGLAAGDRPRPVRAPARRSSRPRRRAPPRSPGSSTRRWSPRSRPHSGPTFVDFPLDHVFMESEEPESDVTLPEPWNGPAADGDAIERAAALLREAERPVIMAGTNLYWGHGEEALRELAEEPRASRCSSTAWARGCLPADHELFFSRARVGGPEGRRRRAGDRRADGLPPGLRRLLRRGHRDRGDRRRRARSASTRGRWPPSSTARCRRRCARWREGAAPGAGHAGVGRAPARGREREARRRGGAAHRRPRAAAPAAPVPRARRACSTATRS